MVEPLAREIATVLVVVWSQDEGGRTAKSNLDAGGRAVSYPTEVSISRQAEATVILFER